MIVMVWCTQRSRAVAGCVKYVTRDVDQATNVIRPSMPKKNKFSSLPSENTSISERIEPSVSRCGMLWIIGTSVYSGGG